MNPPSVETPRDIVVTRDLLLKYDRPGPRYTSYPTAPEWHEDFGPTDYQAALERAAQTPQEPLSLYFHLPFCWERCLFCGCNVVISKRQDVAEQYLDYLTQEMDLARKHLGERRRVVQLHWGGGTPTYLTSEQMRQLFSEIGQRFDIEPDAEIALEVDPRVTTEEQLRTLRELGFNRISMGVQDLDTEVQEAIGRRQTVEQTKRLFQQCRELGFSGVNIDLIYGLPAQTAETWERTIEATIAIRPDRLAVYSYAHLPDKIKHQRRINEIPRPTGPEKYELFAIARRLFLESGYRAIGMDHFALPTDELTQALDARRLHRNFMGYTTAPASDMVSFGVSAISEVGGAYMQNQKRPVMYYKMLDAGNFPVLCGARLSEDDEVRRWTIRQLMCNFYLSFAELKRRYGVDYDSYFAGEEAELAPFYADGFIRRDEEALYVQPLGQVFIRNVCMAFDTYLRKPEHFTKFSRTV